MTRVERVLAFLEFLPVTKGRLAGRRMRLLAGQREFVSDLYGDAAVQIGIKSEPRGNGKTGLATGLTLCHLLGPEAEFRGECLSAAIDREQAAIVFNELEAIIIAVPEFAARTNIVRWHKTIEVTDGPGIGSKFQALSADARRAHGMAPSFWLYDELAQAKNHILLDNLMTAMGKRKRSLGVIISTQAAEDEHALSQMIDDGLAKVDPSIIVHLTSAPMTADPFAEETIRAVNPAFGSFLDPKVVFNEAKRARRLPAFESSFRNLRLNQRIAANAGQQLMTPEVWARNEGAVDEAIFYDGRPVYGGLDLSARTDLTALVLAAEDDAKNVHLKAFAWTPQDTVEARTHRDRVRYDVWAREGFLFTPPGPVIDYDFVAADIMRVTDGMNLVALAYDRWAIKALNAALSRIGAVLPLQSFGQGFQDMNPAIGIFEELALNGRIRHGGHPVMRWCFANTVVARDPAGNRKPDKSRYFGRIDLAVAGLMAVGVLKTQSAPVELASLIA